MIQFLLAAVILGAAVFAVVPGSTSRLAPVEDGVARVEIEALVPLLGHPMPDAALFNGPGPVIVHIFASWARPARIDLEHLGTLAGDTPVIGIAYREEPSAAAEYVAASPGTYDAVALDPHGRFAIGLGVYGVPETFVFRGGRPVYRNVGPLSAPARAALAKALAEPGPLPE